MYRDRVVFLIGRRVSYTSLSPVAVHLAFSTHYGFLGSRKALAAWRSRAVVWSVLNKKDNINAAYNQSSDTSTHNLHISICCCFCEITVITSFVPMHVLCAIYG